MRTLCLVLVALLFVSTGAAAQVTTADGIKALAAGDPVSAHRIFRPLVEGAKPDPLAEFFLATMYHTGSGVRGDLIRACALYAKSARAGNAFAAQASDIGDELLANFSHPFATTECLALRMGDWQEPAAMVSEQGSFRHHSGATHPATRVAIDALVRGDYTKATELLTAITNKWPGDVDHAANFLMAALYENGLAGPPDLVRACALYFRVGTGDLFGEMSLATMLPRVHRMLTPTQAGTCTLLGNLGFDHRFQPAMFTLEPGYWIEFELSAKTQGVIAIVAHPSGNREVELLGLRPGTIFLPIEHRTLPARGAPSGKCHFTQIGTWVPDTVRGEWDLEWSLFEVVGTDVVPVASEVVLVWKKSTRPPQLEVDFSKLVVLRVGADGNPEWAVRGKQILR